MTDYDEITRLRLRLAEVELQRDAFRAMADKAVTDLIRDVMDRERCNQGRHGPRTLARWQVGLPGVTTYTYAPTVPKKPAKRKRRG
jgi:hypothetical protein